MLGFETGPLRLHNVPAVSLSQGCGGTGGPCPPASCPGSTKERDGCLCWLFINVLKLPQLAKRPGDTATAACRSLQRARLFQRLLLLCQQPTVMPQQPRAGRSHPGPSPFAPVACLVGSLRVLLEPADLGQLIKITLAQKKRGPEKTRSSRAVHGGRYLTSANALP